jgi:hypothetical protein
MNYKLAKFCIGAMLFLWFIQAVLVGVLYYQAVFKPPAT